MSEHNQYAKNAANIFKRAWMKYFSAVEPALNSHYKINANWP